MSSPLFKLNTIIGWREVVTLLVELKICLIEGNRPPYIRCPKREYFVE